MSDILELKNVVKYSNTNTGNSVLLLNNINLYLPSKDGRIYSIVAPYHSGKSTLLRIISGIEKPDSGQVLLNSKTLSSVFPYIPELPSSLPWYTVIENISRIPGYKKDPSEVISAVGLSGYEDYVPNEKSIGFRFRISLARALAIEPALILIDDSMKNTDEETHEELVQLLKEVASNFRVTIIYATSSITTALDLSEEIYLMRKKPGEIFHNYKCSGDLIKDLSHIEELFHKENLIKPDNFSI